MKWRLVFCPKIPAFKNFLPQKLIVLSAGVVIHHSQQRIQAKLVLFREDGRLFKGPQDNCNSLPRGDKLLFIQDEQMLRWFNSSAAKGPKRYKIHARCLFHNVFISIFKCCLENGLGTRYFVATFPDSFIQNMLLFYV